jgi:hypothetical protein
MTKPGIDFIAVTPPFYCHDGQGNFVLHTRSKQCRNEVGTWNFGGGKREVGETLAALPSPLHSGVQQTLKYYRNYFAEQIHENKTT